ncbi:MAG: HPr family phosphocarrier protein [Oscillospiraceae bacterium]|nr:HPr family phosphocarrier protein [Oscillospiraceae bacterium]
MITRQIKVLNKSGLHARPASLFVKEASKYKCGIYVSNGTEEKNAKSILHVLTLGVKCGAEVTLTFNGEDEAQAAEALVELISSGLGE